MIFQIMREDAEDFVLVFREHPQLVTRLLQRDLRTHAGDQLGFVKGLRHIIHATGLECLHDEVLVIGGGEKNNRNVLPARIGLQAAAHFQSVGLRHQHIEQDEVGLSRGETLVGLFHAGRGHDIVLNGGEHGADDAEVLLLVINNQNGGTLRGAGDHERALSRCSHSEIRAGNCASVFSKSESEKAVACDSMRAA
jgi:hypothetical protein